LKLPSGQGAPADAADALSTTLATCSGIRSLSAEIGVSGSAGGQRLRGRLLVGVAAPDSARLEAVAPFGPPVFIFVARNDDATLLLPRDDRVLQHGKPLDVLEAVAGLPIDARDLLHVLTACPSSPDAKAATAFGADWRVVADAPGATYLRRDAKSHEWHVVSIVHGTSGDAAWRAEYGAFERGLPRTVRFISADGKRFDVRLALSQVDINPALGDEAFRVQVPRSAQPVTLEELRRNGRMQRDPNARQGVREN
jgi:hypothetical protein